MESNEEARTWKAGIGTRKKGTRYWGIGSRKGLSHLSMGSRRKTRPATRGLGLQGRVEPSSERGSVRRGGAVSEEGGDWGGREASSKEVGFRKRPVRAGMNQGRGRASQREVRLGEGGA